MKKRNVIINQLQIGNDKATNTEHLKNSETWKPENIETCQRLGIKWLLHVYGL